MYYLDFNLKNLFDSCLTMFPKTQQSSTISLPFSSPKTQNYGQMENLGVPLFSNDMLFNSIFTALASLSQLNTALNFNMTSNQSVSTQMPTTQSMPVINTSLNNTVVFPSYNFLLPDMTDYFTSMNTSITASRSAFPSQSSSLYQNMTYKVGKFNLDYWKKRGYNHEMGQKLAMDAVRTCPGKANGQCVGYTRKTINRIYGTNFTNAGAAYNFGNHILSSPSLKGKFRKITKEEIAQGGIPDGAICIWKPGTPGYTKGKAALYGHGAIAYNDRAYADCIVRNMSNCSEIWIPI